MNGGATVIVGGTSGIGLRLAETYATHGDAVVVTGRDPQRTAAAAASIAGAQAVGTCAFDLASPEAIAPALEALGVVDRLVLGAVERDENRVASYDTASALRLVTPRLVGYTEVIHALVPRLAPRASSAVNGVKSRRGLRMAPHVADDASGVLKCTG